jgi:protein phosphatase
MGAHAAGELASKLAVENVAHIYRKHPELSPPEALAKAIREANQEIHRRGEANLAFHNMGTTCSSLLLLPQGAVAGHVGDSRVYMLREKKLMQLTFDHSLVWEMREAGQISGSDDNHAVPKNVITRSLGPQPSVKVDVEGPFPIQVGDTFLICSDGLTGRVEDAEIATLMGDLPPEESAELLINLANLRGGPDNITVIVVRVTGQQMASSQRVAPLEVGGSQEPPAPLNPFWWVGLGVCGLLAVAFGVTHGLNYALVPFVMFVVVALAIGLQKMELGGSGAVRLAGNRRLGKGPHRTYVAKPLKEFVGSFSDALDNGRTSASARGWEGDWDGFESHWSEAKKSQDGGNVERAISKLVKASAVLVDVFKTNSRAE